MPYSFIHATDMSAPPRVPTVDGTGKDTWFPSAYLLVGVTDKGNMGKARSALEAGECLAENSREGAKGAWSGDSSEWARPGGGPCLGGDR